MCIVLVVDVQLSRKSAIDLLEMTAVPCKNTVQQVDPMLVLADHVPFTRIEHHLGLDASKLQGAMPNLSLRRRNTCVVLAVHHERRRFALGDMSQRGHPHELIAASVLVSSDVGAVERRDVVGQVVAQQIDVARPDNGCAKPLRLRRY